MPQKYKGDKMIETNEKGITLIALVITIIVLLILAGVSIAMLTGENGILTQAQNAKKTTEISEEEEIISLAANEAIINNNELTQNSLQKVLDSQLGTEKTAVTYNIDGTLSIMFMDTMRNYKLDNSTVENDIDFNEAFKTQVAPTSQDEERNSNVIGIGTDGKAVDMDLWNYYKMEDGSYALNTKEVYETYQGNSRVPGYLGTYTANGEIIGSVPQYISEDGGKNFYPVTNMGNTFFGEKDLKVEPKIPVTVTSLLCTFSGCNLKNVTNILPRCERLVWTFEINDELVNSIEIPYGVIGLIGTFNKCSSLEAIPKLPENLENMSNAFAYCASLKQLCEIPSTVKNMECTFWYDTGLEYIEITIPENVTNIHQTFAFCTNLEGIITINSNLENHENFLQGTTKSITLTGKSDILNQLAYMDNVVVKKLD